MSGLIISSVKKYERQMEILREIELKLRLFGGKSDARKINRKIAMLLRNSVNIAKFVLTLR